MTYEFKLTFLSNNESIFGLVIDKGEFEIKNDNWIPYIRFRVGFLFVTFQIMRY